MTEGLIRPQNFDFSKMKEVGTVKSTSKAINVDWFGANLSPTNAPANHRVYICLEGSDSVVNVLMDDGTNSNISMSLNAGTVIKANKLYAFDIVLPDGYSYNLQHATATQNVNCWVVEVSVLT